MYEIECVCLQKPVENSESDQVYDEPIQPSESVDLSADLQSDSIPQHADLLLANSSMAMRCCMVGGERAIFFRDFNEANRELVWFVTSFLAAYEPF
jgi:hypothetical protein